MSNLAERVALQNAIGSPARVLHLVDRLCRDFGRINVAMDGQTRLSAVRPETLRDTGRSPDDLTGVPTHDPALPFFLQSGFGRRER
jgi:hypothetical protein